MAFKTGFQKYAIAGDTITCVVDGFTATARIYCDDDTTAPDKRQDGFWPSLNPTNDGYIGDKSQRTLARHLAKAREVMRAWQNDEWFYCGVAVTIERNGIQLAHLYDHALWGVECNYPDSDNSYLMEVANELLGGAIDDARSKIRTLCAA